MLPSSTSTLTSSFFSPGTSALNTCASGVSFQSIRAPAKAAVSELVRGNDGKRLLLPPEPKGKPSKGSQRSREKGSNTLLRRISDMVERFCLLSSLAYDYELEIWAERFERFV
ncbi:hypothetical protein BDA96_01G454000 [Sorghum bicolor]|uniref:Uncharacterized protein n=1 Tax=Sorghum bicolor TaxID=4558 RepID=A0A921S795_SORBI|nr:hypothetical protein BDA96_01G454000 [Sorghum bicolor]